MDNNHNHHHYTSPPQPPLAPAFLPKYWTPTDQVIMEDLLLSHDATVSAASTTTTTTTALQWQWPKREVSNSTLSSPSSCSGSSTPNSTAPLHHQHQHQQSSSPLSSHSSSPQPPTQLHTHASSGRSARVSDEERRARHRAVQKRFVQRKKAAIQQTKQLAATLETQFATLQCAAEAQALARENDALAAQCAATNALAAATLLSASCSPHALSPLEQLQQQIELVRTFFEPLTPAACAAAIDANIAAYDAASRVDASSYITTGLTVMGWHDQRKIDDASVTFVLSKVFSNVRAANLQAKTWRQLSSADTHAQFFSPAFIIKVQVLQVLSDDARVIHRALYNPQTGGIVHGLELLHRVQHNNEFIIFESAIEHNAVHACLHASHKWGHMSVSLAFAPRVSSTSGVESCVFRHGGLLRQFAVSSVKYWLMEMFFMALRYESGMVTPIFTLAAAAAAEVS